MILDILAIVAVFSIWSGPTAGPTAGVTVGVPYGQETGGNTGATTSQSAATTTPPPQRLNGDGFQIRLAGTPERRSAAAPDRRCV